MNHSNFYTIFKNHFLVSEKDEQILEQYLFGK